MTSFVTSLTVSTAPAVTARACPAGVAIGRRQLGNQVAEELDLEVHQLPAEANEFVAGDRLRCSMNPTTARPTATGIGVPLRTSSTSVCATWTWRPINSAPVTTKSTATPVLNATCSAISAGICAAATLRSGMQRLRAQARPVGAAAWAGACTSDGCHDDYAGGGRCEAG